MSPIQSSLLALTMLLLGAGISGLVGLDPRLVALALILAAVLGVGVVVSSTDWAKDRFPFLRSSSDENAELRKALGAELTRCRTLTQRLHAIDKKDDEAVRAVVKDAEAWATRVRDTLRDQRAGWDAVFLSNVSTTPGYGDGSDKSNAMNWLRRREAALNSLMARLG